MWSLADKDGSTEMRKVFVETLDELMKEDGRVIALEADLGGASGFSKLKNSHPSQFINVGIAEEMCIRDRPYIRRTMFPSLWEQNKESTTYRNGGVSGRPLKAAEGMPPLNQKDIEVEYGNIGGNERYPERVSGSRRPRSGLF